MLRGSVLLSPSPACGPCCRDSWLCLSGARQRGCRALLAFPLSYPSPVTGDTLSHESGYIPPSFLPPASCSQVSGCAFLIVFLSPFGEGTDSPGSWSGSRLANTRSAFSRQAGLAGEGGAARNRLRIFPASPSSVGVQGPPPPLARFLPRRKLWSWSGGTVCLPEPLSGAPLGGPAAWLGTGGAHRVGRQARAAEGLAGCNKLSASYSSSIFFFSVQCKRAILTLHL